MKLFDTFSRALKELSPEQPPEVKVYTCGPTVYDHAHIGHWFNYVRMDILIRTLVANGFKPKWVMNITDVGHLTSDADEGEDKLEAGARREGKSAWEIAKIYTAEFLEGMKVLNISSPTLIVKATDHIEDQIDMIKELEAKGFTYKTSDGIYYDVSKFPRYRDFARLDADEDMSMERVTSNPEKRQQSDFALWKFSPKDKKRDMEWDSPWGKGFPGWHIECSAMCRKYLGDTLDIHTGGIDHIPIHHTNEIAQSEAVTGKPLANIWLHSNHVTINGQKISKSLGNGITLNDLSHKGFSFEALRINILESSYRTQSQFSWDSLKAASNRLFDLKAMAALMYQPTTNAADVDFKAIYKEILEIISGDLNTTMVLARLSELTKQLTDNGVKSSDTEDLIEFLKKIDELLGLNLADTKDIGDEAKELVKQREEFRKNSDWAGADKIRQQLSSMGIYINDEPSGPRWQWTS